MSVLESRNVQFDNESSQDVNKQQSSGPKVDLTKAKEARASTPDSPSKSPSLRIKKSGGKSPKIKKVKKLQKADV